MGQARNPDRNERLAKALRENLKRRKARKRAAEVPAPDDACTVVQPGCPASGSGDTAKRDRDHKN